MDRLDRPVLLLLLAFAASFALGQFSSFPRAHAPLRAQFGGLAMVLISGGVYIMASRCCRDPRRLAALTWLFLLAAAVRLLLLYLPEQPAQALHRAAMLPSAPLGSMFWTWFIALAAGQVAANRALGGLAKAGLVLLLSLAMYLTFVEWREWASGWLPGLVAIAVIVTLRRPRLAVVLLCVALCLAAVGADEIARAVWTSEQQYSFWSRFAAARVLWDIASQNLLLGLGPANY